MSAANNFQVDIEQMNAQAKLMALHSVAIDIMGKSVAEIAHVVREQIMMGPMHNLRLERRHEELQIIITIKGFKP